MQHLGRAIRSAYNKLSSSAEEMFAAENRLFIWRHQMVGHRSPLSENPMGIDPAGSTWMCKDYVVKGSKQGIDGRGQHVFYFKGEPVPGDLLITLAGTPVTDEQAQRAERTGYYRVVSVDVRRAPSGLIVYSKIYAVPDRSGRWHEYV